MGIIADSSYDDPLTAIADSLSAIETAVNSIEGRYVAELERASASALNANKTHRNLDYAKAIVDRTSVFYGREFVPQEVMPHLLDIAKLTSIGFTLHDSVIDEVKAKRGGHGQHANTVWDEEVISATSMYTTIAGKTVTLVTGEVRLISAAAAASASEFVCDLAAYESRLGLDDWHA